MISCSGRAGTAVRGAGAPCEAVHGRGPCFGVRGARLDGGLGPPELWRVRLHGSRQVAIQKLRILYYPVSNSKSFDFFDFKFDHSFYSKICTKYHFFCCGCFINTRSSRMT